MLSRGGKARIAGATGAPIGKRAGVKPGEPAWLRTAGGGLQMANRRERDEIAMTPLDNRALANLCGPLDANLRQIEAALDVTIAHRGGTFQLSGAAPQIRLAAETLRRFYGLA